MAVPSMSAVAGSSPSDPEDDVGALWHLRAKCISTIRTTNTTIMLMVMALSRKKAL